MTSGTASHPVAGGLPDHGGYAPLPRPPQVGTGGAQAVHRLLASGAGAYRRSRAGDRRRDNRRPRPFRLNRRKNESIDLAFLVLLECRLHRERAFLLHEVFDYRHDEIASTLDKSPAACRQLVHRANTKLAARRRYEPSPASSAGWWSASSRLHAGRCPGPDQRARRGHRLLVRWRQEGHFGSGAPLWAGTDPARFILGLLRLAPPSTPITVEEVNGAKGDPGMGGRWAVQCDHHPGRRRGHRRPATGGEPGQAGVPEPAVTAADTHELPCISARLSHSAPISSPLRPPKEGGTHGVIRSRQSW